MVEQNPLIHFLAGGVGGTCGAVLTCPLEVLKTRLQSSCANYGQSATNGGYGANNQKLFKDVSKSRIQQCAKFSTSHAQYRRSLIPTATKQIKPQWWICLKNICRQEGLRALFKGLVPNLIGVIPSRGIYFFTYAFAKKNVNQLQWFRPESSPVHMVSAVTGGFVACSLTNPIWFVKTRLQLESKHVTSFQVIKDTYNQFGLRGYWKGVTASYLGITETVIHFVIYEAIKKQILANKGHYYDYERSASDFSLFMIAAACSKTCATCIAYPHEVARTRLREEGSKYTGLLQTLSKVWREEGRRGLYRGLCTQLIRQIPNTAIMMSSYEATVYLFTYLANK